MIIQYLRKNDGRTELTGRRIMAPNDELQDEVRIHRGTPIGVVVAVKIGNGNGFSIGWAKCNKKDTFIKARGLQIAEARAMMGTHGIHKVFNHNEAAELIAAIQNLQVKTPIGMEPVIEKVIKRAVAYFFKENAVEIVENKDRKNGLYGPEYPGEKF
jgi:hypothetical protein